MFPESFPARWIEELVPPNKTVLDPFCGRGTTPFQAVLMGRRALAIDTNPVAYCVTRAKTDPPSLSQLRGRITKLESSYSAADYEPARNDLPEFFCHAYRPETLRQILHLRSNLKWRASSLDCMLAALMLGALHGESSRSSRYLSNQMPRTISTKPAYSVRYWRENDLTAPQRDAFAVLRETASYRYESQPADRGRVEVFNDSFREMPWLITGRAEPVRAVITSPPYFALTSYEEDQWLRLWFLGGPPSARRGVISIDDRLGEEDKYWRMIGDLWRALSRVLDDRGHVVIRLGARDIEPSDLVERLDATTVMAPRRMRLVLTRSQCRASSPNDGVQARHPGSRRGRLPLRHGMTAQCPQKPR